MTSASPPTPRKRTRTVAAIVLAAALGLFVLQNQRLVKARFLWLSGEMPLFILLFIAAAGGFILGLLAARISRRRKAGGKP